MGEWEFHAAFATPAIRNDHLVNGGHSGLGPPPTLTSVSSAGTPGLRYVSVALNVMALVLFDVLSLHGRSVMREPWRDRRKRLEDLLDGRRLPRVVTLE